MRQGFQVVELVLHCYIYFTLLNILLRIFIENKTEIAHLRSNFVLLGEDRLFDISIFNLLHVFDIVLNYFTSSTA